VTSGCLDPTGDLDGTGATNVVDTQCGLLAVLAVLTGGTEAVPPECLADGDLQRADVTCDGSVDVTDVLIVIQIALDLPLETAIDSDQDSCPDLCQGE